MTEFASTDFAAFQSRVADAIKTILPGLRDCKPHPGRFTRKELESFSTSAPSAHVAMPTVRGVRRQGDVLILSAKVVVILTAKDQVSDGHALDRQTAIKNMVGALLYQLPRAGLGDGVLPAIDIAADSLYDKGDPQQGMAMWAIHWTSDLRISSPLDENGQLPATLYYSWVPDVGPDHIEDYEVVASEAAV